MTELIQIIDTQRLRKTIDRVGLEDAGPLLAFASNEQLLAVLDEDLWKNERPGEVEVFDAARFAIWIEVLLDAGEKDAADRVAALPEELLVLGLQRHVWVVDRHELFNLLAEQEDESALIDKALESCVTVDLGEHTLISRNHDGFDAIVTVLLAMDHEHRELVDRALSRCCRISAERIEDNGGLYTVLSAPELLEGDAAEEREHRRSAKGYVAPERAREFLARAAMEPVPSAKKPRELVKEVSSFRAAMLDLLERDATLYARRLDELAHLANVLLAGLGLPPKEAMERAMSYTSAGIDLVSNGAGNVLMLETVTKMFRIGYSSSPRSARKRAAISTS
jgi:hypothetical protein